jgi:L-asparagine transporter-like permease
MAQAKRRQMVILLAYLSAPVAVLYPVCHGLFQMAQVKHRLATCRACPSDRVEPVRRVCLCAYLFRMAKAKHLLGFPLACR